MLRPEKGEGERQKKRTKAPQFFAVTLLFAFPICLAEQATAQELTSFGTVLRPEQSLQLRQGLQGSQLQAKNLTSPKNQRIYALPISLSLDDIDTLKSTLSNYKAQLATLKSKNPLDPRNKTQLDEAIANLTTEIAELEDLIAEAVSGYNKYLDAQETLRRALANYNLSLTQQSEAEAVYNNAHSEWQAKYEALTQAKQLADESLTRLQNAQQVKDQAQQAYDLADASLTTQITVTNNALVLLNEAQTAYDIAQGNLTEALQARDNAQSEYDQALDNYNTNLIPDPDWTVPTQQVEHTRQVPHTETVAHTTYSFQESNNILPSLNTTQWTGAGSGFQGSMPAINDGVLKFSYMNQTVSYTANANLAGTLALTVDFRNLDANRGQQDTYEFRLTTYDAQGNVNGESYHYVNYWHDWMTRTIEVTPTSPVASYKVDLTGFDAGYWYGTYGPEMRNPRLSAIIQTETTTYEEVTTYTTETYYTTEPVLTQGTKQVDIGEGGQATFTAPAGATFTGSTLRYESYTNSTCGRDVTPQNLVGTTTVTLQALNSVWGDPCGGQRKHLVGTLTYLGQPTAPLIKNPALLTIVNEKEANLNSAITSYDIRVSELDSASTNLSEADSTYSTEVSNKQTAEAGRSDSWNNLSAAVSNYDTAVASNQTATETLTVATEQEASAASVKTETFTALETAQVKTEEALTTKVEAEKTEGEAKSIAQESYVTAKRTEGPDFAVAETIINKEPEPEEGSKEIPAELSAENLMEVDLDAVDPTELTVEQAEQLKEAALETFLTAEQGSPEYEQALDALYLAAEQDDIELSPELAAIPGLAGAVELVNFFGNAGADMSPKVREESEKVVVTAVVAAGAAIQSAAAAATTASASTGSGSRRIGK